MQMLDLGESMAQALPLVDPSVIRSSRPNVESAEELMAALDLSSIACRPPLLRALARCLLFALALIGLDNCLAASLGGKSLSWEEDTLLSLE